MWSHVFILIGHGTMMAGWWLWYARGYAGVAETLRALGAAGGAREATPWRAPRCSGWRLAPGAIQRQEVPWHIRTEPDRAGLPRRQGRRRRRRRPRALSARHRPRARRAGPDARSTGRAALALRQSGGRGADARQAAGAAGDPGDRADAAAARAGRALLRSRGGGARAGQPVLEGARRSSRSDRPRRRRRYFELALERAPDFPGNQAHGGRLLRLGAQTARARRRWPPAVAAPYATWTRSARTPPSGASWRATCCATAGEADEAGSCSSPRR